MSHLNQGSEGGSLVIGPLVAVDLVPESRRVVVPAAHVDDKIVVVVVLLEVARDVLDVVAVGFFEQVGGGEGHGDDPFGDVGEIELLAFVESCYFGAGDHLANQAEHGSVGRLDKTIKL